MSNVNKPVIPRNVAEAIEYFKNPPKGVYTNWGNDTIIDCTLNQGSYNIEYEPMLSHLRKISFDTLLAALVNGYDVEKSPEELAEEKRKVSLSRLAASYHAKRFSATSISDNGYLSRIAITRNVAFADGIKFTLDELGVSIEGVNA